MTSALSDSDPDVPEEVLSFKNGINLFEKHVQAISTGSPNSIMLSLSTLHSADFTSERSRSLFYQVGGYQSLISLLTLNRQADLGHAPVHITTLIFSECLKLIKKLVQYDNISRILFAGPISQTPEQYNKATYQRRTDSRLINYEDYNYVTLDAGIPIYLSILINTQADPDIRILAIEILSETLKCGLPRRVFHHLDGPASVVKRLSSFISQLFVGNIFTSQLKPNKDIPAATVKEVSSLLYMTYNLCSSGSARSQLRTNGIVPLLCTLLDFVDVQIYEPCVLCLSKMVQHNNQHVLQELIHSANSISRICSMILPEASTQFLRAAALVLAKVANVPGGDVVVTTSGGIQPLINMLTVDDSNTLMAACQVIVGISSKPCVHDGDPDSAEASIFSMNHMIAKELINNKVLTHIQELLDKCGIEVEEPAPPPANLASGQYREVKRNPRTRLFKLRDNVSSDLFDQCVTPAETPMSAPGSVKSGSLGQGRLMSASTLPSKEGTSTNADHLGDEVPLSTWSNLTSWLLHALANICPSEHIVPVLKRNPQLLKTLLGLTGSCNPCVIRWACQCLANLAKNAEISKVLHELGSLDVLFSVLKRCTESTALEEDYGKLAKAAIVASAAEALTGILEDPKIATIAGRSVTGIFGLLIEGLKTISNGTARAWLCGVIARLAKERENSIVLLEHRAVDYLSFLCVEASQLLDSYDFALREQICLAIANLCFSAPFYRKGRQSTNDADPAQDGLDGYLEKTYSNSKQQQMYHLFKQEYAKYGYCYGDGNVVVEFGKRGVIAAVCTFLTPVSLGEHVQRISLQEFQCLRAAAHAAHALSAVGRNAILFYKENTIEKLLYLIAIGDKVTQTSAASTIRCIRTKVFEMLSVLKRHRGSKIGIYTRKEHAAIIGAVGKDDSAQIDLLTGSCSTDRSMDNIECVDLDGDAVPIITLDAMGSRQRPVLDGAPLPKPIKTSLQNMHNESTTSKRRTLHDVTPASVYTLGGELISSGTKPPRNEAHDNEDNNDFVEIYLGKIEQFTQPTDSGPDVINHLILSSTQSSEKQHTTTTTTTTTATAAPSEGALSVRSPSIQPDGIDAIELAEAESASPEQPDSELLLETEEQT